MNDRGSGPAPRGLHRWRRLGWFLALYLASLCVVAFAGFLLRRLM